MALATPQTALVATNSTLDQMLASQKPLMMLLWNGDSLRSDLKNEFDKIVTEHGNWLQIVTINTHDNPHAAARFDVEKHPVVIGWHNGEQIVRRSRPWGADVRALADQLLAALPPETAVAQPVQQIIKANEPFHVTDADFEQMVIDSDLPVLVDFWANLVRSVQADCADPDQTGRRVRRKDSDREGGCRSESWPVAGVRHSEHSDLDVRQEQEDRRADGGRAPRSDPARHDQQTDCAEGVALPSPQPLSLRGEGLPNVLLLRSGAPFPVGMRRLPHDWGKAGRRGCGLF